MHTSTSPLYPIIASLDVAAKTMSLNGMNLVDRALREAIAFRREMARRHQGDPTWFQVWQPSCIATLPAADLLDPALWILGQKDNWHGFPSLDPNDEVLLDPTKVTVIIPDGIPSPLVIMFLRSRGIEVAKSTFKTFLLLFSHGVTMGNSSSLVSELDQFHRLFQKNVHISEVLPGLQSENWANIATIKDLSAKMTETLSRFPPVDLVTLPKIFMKPSEAYKYLVKRKVSDVPIGLSNGRVCAVLVVPYPPGIPLLMPGEIINQNIIDMLLFHQEFNREYPGLETEIHGVSLDADKNFLITTLDIDTASPEFHKSS